MKRARRVLSHHGSDCPEGPHPFKTSRCMILTRVDRADGTSEAWVSGDCAETMPMHAKRHVRESRSNTKSERVYRLRHSFKRELPTHYGGGFWEYVELPPPVAEPVPVPDIEALTDDDIAVIRELRARGFAVIVWTPEELGDVEPSQVEDASIEKGWDIIATLKAWQDATEAQS